MTTLSGFEDGLRDAVLDKSETELAEQRDQLADESERNWRTYASRNGYDIEHIWQDVTLERVRRRRKSVSTRIEWPPLTALFEYGVDPHTMTGDFAFFWESPPQGTRPPGAPSFVNTNTINWGSVTGGIDASRAIRDALDGVRGGL